MWQKKKLSENLFCIELSNFFYPDEILGINLSISDNNWKSDGLLATFSGFSLVENQQPLLCLPQNRLSANYLLSTLGYPQSKYAQVS